MIALTHKPSPNMQACERTFVSEVHINVGLAAQQHQAYCAALSDCGAEVTVLDVNWNMPDGAFIEDTAVVLDEVAILCSMGAASRQREPAGIEKVLREFRPIERIELPATLEGGDVLRIGRRLLVGQSSRSNAAGIAAVQQIAGRFGYQVTPIPVQGSLHLKTACTALPDGRLLINPAWIDERTLTDFDLIPIPEAEPWGANVCLVGQSVILPAAHVQTAKLISRLGFASKPVEISEFSKAEGGVTCLSLLLNEGVPRP
ncbi:MAG: dimethylarginine dimethylaminohydrolase family protein [Pirellulaceae bacterium]